MILALRIRKVYLVKIAWFVLVLQLLSFPLARHLVGDTETTAIILIAVNSVAVAAGVMRYKGLSFHFFVSYVLRLGAMLWEIYGRGIYILPHGASDGDGFFASAAAIATDLTLVGENLYGGVFSKLMGLVFYITSPERLIGQYINVLLGVSTVVIIYNTLAALGCDRLLIRRTVLLAVFFPQAVILSAVFLREGIITFLLAISCYFFVQWYLTRSPRYVFHTVISVLAASVFHSAAIFPLCGYILMFLLYDHNKRCLHVTTGSMWAVIVFLILTSLLLSDVGNIFVGRFRSIDAVDSVFDQANGRIGGSAYLTGLEITSVSQLVLYSPIRMFYFLSSPLPFGWRGFADALVFFTDSMLYLWTMLVTWRNLKKCADRPLAIGLLIALGVFSIVFGVGVSNAGTAMRHRHKILPIVLVLCSLVRSRHTRPGLYHSNAAGKRMGGSDERSPRVHANP